MHERVDRDQAGPTARDMVSELSAEYASDEA